MLACQRLLTTDADAEHLLTWLCFECLNLNLEDNMQTARAESNSKEQVSALEVCKQWYRCEQKCNCC